MAGDLERIVALAADVERWPVILPHYRWVTLLDGGGDRKTVEMAARRGRIPVKWRAIQESIERDDDPPIICFRHIGGVTKGMDVAWTFRLQTRRGHGPNRPRLCAAVAAGRQCDRRPGHRAALRRGDRRQDARHDQGDRREPRSPLRSRRAAADREAAGRHHRHRRDHPDRDWSRGVCGPACARGRSAIRAIDRFDPARSSSKVAGQIDFEPLDYMAPKRARRLDRFSQFALISAQMALDDAGLSAQEAGLRRRRASTSARRSAGSPSPRSSTRDTSATDRTGSIRCSRSRSSAARRRPT